MIVLLVMAAVLAAVLLWIAIREGGQRIDAAKCVLIGPPLAGGVDRPLHLGCDPVGLVDSRYDPALLEERARYRAGVVA